MDRSQERKERAAAKVQPPPIPPKYAASAMLRLGLSVLAGESQMLGHVRVRTTRLHHQAALPFSLDYLMDDAFDNTIDKLKTPSAIIEMHDASKPHPRIHASPSCLQQLPTVPVRLGLHGPVVQCHIILLEAVLKKWPIPACYTVDTLAARIGDLDLHPHVVRCFFCALYLNTSDDVVSCVLSMLLIALMAVLLRLGVASDDMSIDYLKRVVAFRGYFSRYSYTSPPKMIKSIAYWLAWVDGQSRDVCLTEHLAKSIQALGNSETGDEDEDDYYDNEFSVSVATERIRKEIPNWKPTKRLLVQIVDQIKSKRARAFKSVSSKTLQITDWKTGCVDFARAMLGLKKPFSSLNTQITKSSSRIQQAHKTFHRVQLPEADFTIVADGGRQSFRVHSWIMMQWPYFARMMSAELSEATNRVLELPSDMPTCVVECILCALYGVDQLSVLDSNSVMARMIPDGAVYLLQNALEFELVVEDDENALNYEYAFTNLLRPSRFQKLMAYTCTVLSTVLEQEQSMMSFLVRPDDRVYTAAVKRQWGSDPPSLDIADSDDEDDDVEGMMFSDSDGESSIESAYD